MRIILSTTTVLLASVLLLTVCTASAQTNNDMSVQLAQPNFYITTPQTGEQVAIGASSQEQYPANSTSNIPTQKNFYTQEPSKKTKASTRQRPASKTAQEQTAAYYAAYNSAAAQASNAGHSQPIQQANYPTANQQQQAATTYQTSNPSYVAHASENKKGFMNRLFHKHDKPVAVQVSNSPYKPSKLTGLTQAGMASWYGKDFDGGKTANGERYNMESMTAAHKTLPFGTIVKVRNERNGQECFVRINNRGPFIKGRIIDVSKAAARQLGMIGSGVAKVTCQVVGRS